MNYGNADSFEDSCLPVSHRGAQEDDSNSPLMDENKAHNIPKEFRERINIYIIY